VDLNSLAPYLLARAQQDQFSGVVRITQGEAEIWSGAYGLASRAWSIPNTLATRFDTASITKLFTAVAALQLVDRGQLALDTRVMPQLGLSGTAISPDVTVYHLLTHTSGIADDAEEENGELYEDVWKTRANYWVRETRDFLPQFAYKAPNFPPGHGCRYCNVSYIVLGLLIEQASGLPYRDYVRQHIFAPASMAQSDFFALDRVEPNVAEGADPLRDEGGTVTGWKRNLYSFPPIGSPDSGAHVTAADLDRFLRCVQASQLLSPALTQAFFTPQVHYRAHDGWDQWYGYGLWFHLDPAGRVVCYQKEGTNTGVSGMIRHYPAQDLTVVILSNMEDGAWEPMREIHRLIMAA
jgi:CubicO group peptidase (beta-lactamase class C family)